MMMPNIDTERLTLRVPTLADFADSKAMWGDPEVVRHIGGTPFTEEECWARLHRYVGHWALLGFGMWVLRDKATGTFVGEAGFLDVKRAIVPPFETAEVGWALARAAHGQGYATEAVRAVLAWGEAHFGSPRFACMIDPGNDASVRVATKVGFHPTVQTTYKGAPVTVYQRP